MQYRSAAAGGKAGFTTGSNARPIAKGSSNRSSAASRKGRVQEVLFYLAWCGDGGLQCYLR